MEREKRISVYAGRVGTNLNDELDAKTLFLTPSPTLDTRHPSPSSESKWYVFCLMLDICSTDVPYRIHQKHPSSSQKLSRSITQLTAAYWILTNYRFLVGPVLVEVSLKSVSNSWMITPEQSSEMWRALSVRRISSLFLRASVKLGKSPFVSLVLTLLLTYSQ